MDNRFFSLPFQFNTEKLAADLATCEAQQWAMHFNKNDYAGDWTGIALRSATGNSIDIKAVPGQAFQDTPLLAQCPYFREILDTLEFQKETVRLLALAPGSVIKEHRDQGLGYEHGCFRLHIPITTDDQVSFIVDKTRLPMGAGQCWYANFDLPHSVLHEGNTRRIHLVIDGTRNEWTDRLFGEIGYDFDLEAQQKEYDDATKAQMIEHLSMMDTDAAREIIARLEIKRLPSSKSTMNGSEVVESPMEHGWVPTDVQSSDKGLVFKWLYVGKKSFSEPFFQDTLQIAKQFELNKIHPNRRSSIEQLIKIAQNTDSIEPTAFIFHVSRCGSTLLSQLLGTDARNIVLSEAPLLDTILRLPYHEHRIAQDTVNQVFLAALRLLGRKRNSTEEHLFIKTDCWHVFFYDTLRRLFPKTLFILLYRSPDEVLYSQQKQRGIQSMPFTLESALTGIQEGRFEPHDLDGYFLQLLERIFAGFARIKAENSNVFLINYNTGQAGMISALEKGAGIEFSQDTLVKMEKRGHFHAKKPYELFEEEKPTVFDPDRLQNLMALYDQLDGMQ
ncbi:MAG: aspartyl/asparaginyl beta-hydroxylase domain-containing protein [Phycisphaerae bacterium]|nr:aspartyl/asparaginyl beta-hydroxylase domain-containing protein [Saprospiraceae bacterium]